ncbi:MAG: hypothetical protein KGN33_08005 [Paracoccaceae bacterium]|nr:hypothetical protein [Paracoccaceae bacterium]
MKRVQIAALSVLLLALIVFALALAFLHGGSKPPQAASASAPSGQGDAGQTAPTGSLFESTASYGVVADTRTPPEQPAGPPAAGNKSTDQNKPTDIYLQHAQAMEKQRLDEQLQAAAKADQERELAYDSPLAKGNYSPRVDVGPKGVSGSSSQLATSGAASVGVQGASPSIEGTRHTSGPTGTAVAAAVRSVGPDVGYLQYGAVAARSPNEIKKGSVIPAVLLTAINSNLPGNVTAQVSENVYDTETGGTLLIPAGSRLFGTYSANVKYGQDRAVVLWSHLIFPDGSTLLLENQVGTDAAGQSGFHDIRHGNFLRILGANFLFSIIGAGQQAFEAKLQNAISNSASTTSALGNLVTGAAGIAAGNAATSAAGVFNNQNANVGPTLIIRSGYRFNVLVAKDIVLKPWRVQ